MPPRTVPAGLPASSLTSASHEPTFARESTQSVAAVHSEPSGDGAEGCETLSVQAFPSHQRQRVESSGSAYHPGGVGPVMSFSH